MTTRAETLAQTREAFRRAGLAEPALDARLLAAEAFGVDALALVTGSGEGVAPEAAARLAALVARRLAGEPVGRILGLREFWGLSFRLGPDILEPRPDTETVVEAALDRLLDRSRPLRLLDLGTGSGCLLVALLHELPAAFGIGIDRSAGAVAIARENAAANGVAGRSAFLCGDWATALAARFDLVVSNPPYIGLGEAASLAPEVARHDPALALYAGPDGLAAYRSLLPALPDLLVPGGAAVLEIGHAQAEPVRVLAEAAGLRFAGLRRDLAGRPRAVTLLQREGLVCA